ncbi:hypothetical protein MMC17_005543 [Xylographa soralifera]|nr:hypothetical protein [Xylographa soralifera]
MERANHHAPEETTQQSVAPLGVSEQHELTEATLAHIEKMSLYVSDHSGEAIHPPPGCPAEGLFGRIRVGSRNSTLALIQANHVVAALFKTHHGFSFPVSTHSVKGDANKTAPFLKLASEVGKTNANAAKSLWTMELEDKLLDGDLDIIVHCLKDMPTVLPEGCVIGCIPQRADPTDAFVVKRSLPYKSLQDLPAGAVVGTSSVRRTAQLKHYYPHLEVQECRGNVDSRLRKLDADDSPYTAIVIATAGLVRLNKEHRITARLTAPTYLHAVGQGALGIEIRSNDANTLRIISAIDHRPTRLACLAERSLLRYLQGGCSAPIAVQSSFRSGSSKLNGVANGTSNGESHGLSNGAYNGISNNTSHGTPNGATNGASIGTSNSPRTGERGEGSGTLELVGTILHPKGGVEIRARHSGFVSSDADAEAIGVTVAEKMLALGAGALLKLIDELQHAFGPPKAGVANGVPVGDTKTLT